MTSRPWALVVASRDCGPGFA